MRELHLRVTRTARYVLLGGAREVRDADAGGEPRVGERDPGPGVGAVTGVPELWLACHGYRQLARYFARPFAAIAGPDRRIALPEGLSRFYVDDDGGAHGPDARVGATWMTREDRLNEIDDYVAYLDALAAHLGAPPATPGSTRSTSAVAPPRLTAFGFSQGAATASRWAAYGSAELDRLVLWAGLPAHDLDLAAAGPRLAHLDMVLAHGGDDPWVTAAAVERAVEELHDAGVPARAWRYEGGHSVEAEALGELVAALEQAR